MAPALPTQTHTLALTPQRGKDWGFCSSSTTTYGWRAWAPCSASPAASRSTRLQRRAPIFCAPSVVRFVGEGLGVGERWGTTGEEGNGEPVVEEATGVDADDGFEVGLAVVAEAVLGVPELLGLLLGPELDHACVWFMCCVIGGCPRLGRTGGGRAGGRGRCLACGLRRGCCGWGACGGGGGGSGWCGCCRRRCRR